VSFVTQAHEPAQTFLSTRRGKLTLALLCMVAFLDFVDTSIVTVALPSIKEHLHFSVQSLQWVVSGYFLTYGGLILLGGRAADLVGRRRVLMAGTGLFGLSSLVAGLAGSAGVLTVARLSQGAGAALMSPAALSILTTSFHAGADRGRALGAWGAVGGLSAAIGVTAGGLLSEGPGWRWIFFVNLPVCALLFPAILALIDDDRRRAPLVNFDALGAVLVTGGMLLLAYALIEAPTVGWGSARTIACMVGALAVLAAFAVNEYRHANPLVPLSIFRIRGLAAADATQVLAMGGISTMFFFTTIFMQSILHFSPIETGLGYVPIAFGVTIGAGISSQLVFPRVGTRPVIVAGALVCGAALFWISRITTHSTYAADLLPPFVLFALGVGCIFVGIQTAANAGVPAETAGLAAALITASQQLGAALGLAIFAAIATSRTHHLLSGHVAPSLALTSGFQRGLIGSAAFVIVAAAIATRTANTGNENARAVTSPIAAVEAGSS
jgi:EmrB/QacA subfamily drug resistance transporter